MDHDDYLVRLVVAVEDDLSDENGTSATLPARSHMSAVEPFADMGGIGPNSRL